MVDPLVLIPVSPIGTERARGIVTRESGCSFAEWDEPIYPDPPPDIRTIRLEECELSMGQVARALGIRASDVSGLEHGRFIPACGWDEYRNRLRAIRKEER